MNTLEVLMGAVLSKDHTFDGPHGPLRLRIYAARISTLVGLVWVHGGGFASGDITMPEADWVARSLAERGVTVVSVDYQLAPLPKHGLPADMEPHAGVHFPVASEEVGAAHGWTVKHAEELELDPERISLGGASAGGNLAAGVALRIRDRGFAQPQSLILAYPALHAELPRTRESLTVKLAERGLEDQFGPDMVRWMSLNYVGDPALLESPYAFPGSAPVLNGLPPTLILNAEVDALRASGEAFAAGIALAGGDVSVIAEPGSTHGFLNSPGTPAAERSVGRMVGWLTTGLAC
jgi:acetyl esterase